MTISARYSRSRTEFGFWQGKRKPVIESAVKPLYEAIQLARASGDLSPLKGRISKTLREELETEISRRHTALSSATPKGALEWRMQGYEGVKVLSQRMNEMQRSKVLQMLVRFQSKQTLAPQGATSSSPQKVVEVSQASQTCEAPRIADSTALGDAELRLPAQALGRTARKVDGDQEHPDDDGPAERRQDGQAHLRAREAEESHQVDSRVISIASHRKMTTLSGERIQRDTALRGDSRRLCWLH